MNFSLICATKSSLPSGNHLDELKKAISSKTKAIVPVHLNGMAVDIKKIKSIIKNKKIYIIEDSAQALFSKNKKNFLGTEADIGCYSLSTSISLIFNFKNIAA